MEMLRIEFEWGRNSLVLVDCGRCLWDMPGSFLQNRIRVPHLRLDLHCGEVDEGWKRAPLSLSFDRSRLRRLEKSMIHQQNRKFAVSLCGSAATDRTPVPQTYPPRPQYDYKTTVPSHSVTEVVLLLHCGAGMFPIG